MPDNTAPAASWKRPFHLLLLLNGLGLIAYTGARFAVLLFAVKLQALPVITGLLFAINSLIPALTSVHAGKLLDRTVRLRNPMLLAMSAVACGILVPAVWPGMTALLVFCIFTGSSFNLFRISGQQVIGRYGPPEDRPANYNLYAQQLAIGNLGGPLIAGFAIEHFGFVMTFVLFALLIAPVIAVLLMDRLYLPQGEARDATAAPGKDATVLGLLRMPELRRVLIASVVLLSAWDCFGFVWPLYASQLQFPASQIGLVAGVFSSGTFVVRVLASLLLRRFTQWQLLLLSMAGSAAIFTLFPLLSGFAALLVLAFVLGMVLGVVQPMGMSLIYEAAPADRRGEVIGLRLTMIFSVHIVMPLLLGALGTALGIASVWWIIAATLVVGGWMTRGQWRPAEAPH